VPYFDNAATTYPKPEAVYAAIRAYLEEAGNPGRSSHAMARAAESYVWSARQAVAEVLGAAEPDRIVFCLNATMALNIAIKSLARPGQRVLTTSFEHNSVTRVLHSLRADGVGWSVVPPGDCSPIDLEVFEQELGKGDVSLVVVTHASNVTGAIVPVHDVAALTGRHGIPLVVDGAQSAGHVAMDVSEADVFVFSGHKGLFGPQGTGGMFVGPGVDLEPLLFGGSGGRSELPVQPRWLPYSLEVGTANGVGLAGLGAAARYVQQTGIGTIVERESALRARLVEGLERIPGVVIRDTAKAPAVGLVSVDFQPPMTVTSVERVLDERYGVCVRAGLHCAPLAHQTLGTFPEGTLRISLSHLNTEQEVDGLLAALDEVVPQALAGRGTR
jgi:cysteine desulfurase / selenocysteine lyase